MLLQTSSSFRGTFFFFLCISSLQLQRRMKFVHLIKRGPCSLNNQGNCVSIAAKVIWYKITKAWIWSCLKFLVSYKAQLFKRITENQNKSFAFKGKMIKIKAKDQENMQKHKPAQNAVVLLKLDDHPLQIYNIYKFWHISDVLPPRQFWEEKLLN